MTPSSIIVRAPVDPGFQEAATSVNLYNVLQRVVRGEKAGATAMMEIEPAMRSIIQ